MLQYRFLSVITAALVAILLTVPMVQAAQPDPGFISGYVRDGLYFESKMDLNDAIISYKKADPSDRYAWMRLANAYRTLDAYGEIILKNYLSEQKRYRTSSMFLPWSLTRYQYWNYGSDRAKFGYYGPNRPKFGHSGKGFSHPAREFSIVKCGWLSDPQLISGVCSDLYMYRASRRLAARLAPTVETCLLENDLAEAWNEVAASPDSAEAWLSLGRVCAKTDPRQGQAAFHVVLLSNPNQAQAEEARLAIDTICSPWKFDHKIIRRYSYLDDRRSLKRYPTLAW